MAEGAQSAQVGQMMANWPLDEDGRPMQLVGFAMSEKIGLPNYSNVDVGPAVVYRFIKQREDTDEGRVQERREFHKACELVEEIMGEHREMVLNNIKGQK